MIRPAIPVLASLMLACIAPAAAQDLSSSIMRPSVVDPNSGAVGGRLPGASGAKSYYLALDLKAGSLTTQLQISGPTNGNRRLTFELLNASLAMRDSVSVRSGFGAADEKTRTFAIDSTGRQVVRLIVEGEETGAFCVMMGGSALPNAAAASCASPRPASETPEPVAAPRPPVLAEPSPQIAPVRPSPPAGGGLSTSIMRPTRIDPAESMVAGALPGGAKSYYLTADLKAGNLLAQAQITGRANGERRLTLERLGSDAAVADSTFVRAGFGTKDEVTKVFPVVSSGPHVFRLTVTGEETGAFCVLFGGTALPSASPAACPVPARAASAEEPRVQAPEEAPPAPPSAIEVIVAKCEERLRVGADFLFDFDHSELRPESGPALDQLARRVAATDRGVLVEGHTDAKGSDAYNQALSERRAESVRGGLVGRGLRAAQLTVRGYGKARAVAPNLNPDGSDYPEGRQKNRRVEVVVSTCRDS